MPRATLTDEITAVLREEVLRGQYRPGERLPSERDLAARFATTRGVVRVALKKLEQLGVAEVRPGGARVQPISEASLEALGYLLALDGPLDIDLVEQILETVGALVAASGRRLVENGLPEATARARALIAEMRAPELSDDEVFDCVHRLGHLVMEANDNLVMRIVLRSLRTEVIGHLRERGLHASQGPKPDRAAVLDAVGRLEGAIASGDGLAGYAAAHDMWGFFRRAARELLARASETARGERPISSRRAQPAVAS